MYRLAFTGHGHTDVDAKEMKNHTLKDYYFGAF